MTTHPDAKFVLYFQEQPREYEPPTFYSGMGRTDESGEDVWASANPHDAATFTFPELANALILFALRLAEEAVEDGISESIADAMHELPGHITIAPATEWMTGRRRRPVNDNAYFAHSEG